MYKAAYTFRLFLMGSLILLAALFANTSLLSNIAMAQKMDTKMIHTINIHHGKILLLGILRFFLKVVMPYMTL
jgi:hypothetical protein